LVNFIYYEQARSSVKDDIEVVLYKSDRIKEASKILLSIMISELEIDGSSININDFLQLEKELKKSKIKIITKKDLNSGLRMIKDKHELDILSKACSITDNAFTSLLTLSSMEIRELNELSLANKLEGFCIKSGGSGRSFDYVIASGPGSSMPHYISTHKDISNRILLMDFGTLCKHYCSDITRTIFIGKDGLNGKLKEIYKIVLEAQLKALEACKEGIRCDELDSIARKYIGNAGYGDQFGHGLGHGVGLEVHEGPYVTGKVKTVLKENMVITIEPGIYIPGFGGVRIEDMVVVEKNGCRNLYSSKKDFTFLP
jgi:Xaa-Pro aminopeptidase